MAKNFLEREILSGAITGSFEPFLTAQENQVGNKMMIRNTLTAERIELRFNSDPTQIFSLEFGEKMVFGGITQFSGKLVEIRSVASIPESVRLNLIG